MTTANDEIFIEITSSLPPHGFTFWLEDAGTYRHLSPEISITSAGLYYLLATGVPAGTTFYNAWQCNGGDSAAWTGSEYY